MDEKNEILNQCNSIFALQSFDQTGLEFLSNYMGTEYSRTLNTLPKQHAVLVGKSSSSAHPILFEIIDLKERYKISSKNIICINTARCQLSGISAICWVRKDEPNLRLLSNMEAKC